jgi:hypothetical protein
MSRMLDRMPLSDAQKKLIDQNTHVEWVNDVTGNDFFAMADDLISAIPSDLVIINPLSAYHGGDLRDDKMNNHFLRVQLSGLMNKHQCAMLVIHHTTKTSYMSLEEYQWFDWMYNMAGGSALTNWARAILIIVPTPVQGTYKFIAAKRGEKLGWQDRTQWWCHSVENGKFLWIPATQAQIDAAKVKKNASQKISPDDVLKLIPVIDPILQAELYLKAEQKFKVSEKTIRRCCEILLQNRRIFEHKMPRPPKKPAVGYSQTP